MVKPKLGIKRLFCDIEVSPNVVLSWRIGYDLSLTPDNIIEERKIMCIGFKWEHEDRVKVLRWDKDKSDRAMLLEFAEVLKEADEVVWHHGDKFDSRHIKARCIINGIPPLAEVKSVDTKKLASRKFNFNCNTLDYLAKLLGLGGKTHVGYGLWKDALLKNCRLSLNKLCSYCADDVLLLEKVFKKLQPHSKVQTHQGVTLGHARWTCPRDGSSNVRKSKTRVSAAGIIQHQMLCNDCEGYFTISDAIHKQYKAKPSCKKTK